MFKWLFPQSTDFFDIFDRHVHLAIDSVEELLSYCPQKTAALRAKRIKELEHQADIVTHQCVEALRKTFITPFRRDDIHQIISKMDDIIDSIEQAASLFSIYHLEEMTPEAKQLVICLKQACEELQKAIKNMRTLKYASEIKQSFIVIHQLENAGDAIYIQAIGKLFDEFPDTRMVIKWKEIYENLEQALDHCEDVANLIEGVILESA
jgi:predicted phosphate transport protein (TIGR00153 family)